MQLLVSVRDPTEVDAALKGGANIIDAKEPARGALGPVTADVLRAIDRRVPDEVSLSVALGDGTTEAAIAEAIALLPLGPRRAPVYLKMGFAPYAEARSGNLIAAAVCAAQRHRARPLVIAVEYADRTPGLLPGWSIVESAAAAGAAGILVDTATKDGRSLFAWWSDAGLRAWVERARALGLSTAVAGSLGAAELARVAVAGPEVAGVRGAACSGGRSGAVQVDRVRALRAALA